MQKLDRDVWFSKCLECKRVFAYLDASLEFKETIWFCCEACRESYYRKHHKKECEECELKWCA